MSKIKKWSILAGCLLLIACQQEKFPKGIKHVVVIGIDGLSSQGLIEAHTPCMDSLLQHGAYSYTDRCVMPTVSKPNWHAMIHGAGPDITGVENDPYDFPIAALTENHTFPNIFRIVRKQIPSAEIGSIYHWDGIGSILEDEIMDLSKHYSTALETAQKSAEYILDKKPTLTFVHLDEVDHYGHADGHMSPAYLKGVEEIDGYVKLIVDAIQQAGIAESTLIMVVSDHGGILHAHGGKTYEEFNTPIIFSGKGAKKNYHIRQQIYKYDVAANIAFALGVQASQVWVGRPTQAAFEGFNEPENLWTDGLEVLPPPRFASKTFYPPHGDMSVDEPVEVNIIVPVGVEGEIRYTTDGTLPVRTSTLYEGKFTLDKSATVKARLFSANGESPQRTAQYRVVDTKAGNGLNYAFYRLPDAKKMPDFATLKPIATGITYEVNMIAPELKALKEQCKSAYGVTYSGWIQIDEPGMYKFNIWSSCEHRLYVNSNLILYKESLQEGSAKIELQKGRYPVKVEFFSNGRDAGLLDLYYDGVGSAKGVIPANILYRIAK